MPTVYPRVCGGTPTVADFETRPMGLSPRVRGNLPRGERQSHSHGSIPACAGEPATGGRPVDFGQVYPRVCGGTGIDHVAKKVIEGLSPRVRGNLLLDQRLRANLRSIPACAGEPHRKAIQRRLREVYPRVCGGTEFPVFVKHKGHGLSPRVRGNRCWIGRRGTRWWSIPACAGEPHGRSLTIDSATVYPRVCGGTVNAHAPKRRAPGLSPRVRGNRLQSLPSLVEEGSIPACAGEPSTPEHDHSQYEVYPRVCGGTAAAMKADAVVLGLSPRVRGNHHRESAV